MMFGNVKVASAACRATMILEDDEIDRRARGSMKAGVDKFVVVEHGRPF
jgi:hypothetical protein